MVFSKLLQYLVVLYYANIIVEKIAFSTLYQISKRTTTEDFICEGFEKWSASSLKEKEKK